MKYTPTHYPANSKGKITAFNSATKGQSKSASAVESTVNIVVGFFVAVVANVVVLPCFGVHVALQASIGIAVVFTAISFVRAYVLRRFFNWIEVRSYNGK